MASPTGEPPSLDAMLNNLVYILEAHKAHVRSRRDWALLFAHSYLLASDFAFAGVQQQQQQQEQQAADTGRGRSPILPAECWSDSGRGDDIVLLYRRIGGQQQQQQQHYVLCIVTMGQDLIVSLAQQDTALHCTLPGSLFTPVDAAQAGSDAIQSAYPEVERLHSLLWEQLFRQLPFNSPQQQHQQQQQQQQQQQRPIPMPHPHPQPMAPPHRQPQVPVLGGVPVAGPFDYGRADLDPFGGAGIGPGGVGPGGGGGGMRFDPLRAGPPRRPGQPFNPYGPPLPPGAVPPGARFDPFGPDGGGGPGGGPGGPGAAGPDPDHARPPGWGNEGFGGGRGGGFGGGGNFYM